MNLYLFLWLWIFLLTHLLFAGIPVSEDGAQLTYIQQLRDLTVKIQSDQALSQQHLAKLRAMEEGSKAVALAMAQMDSLVKHGQLLSQDPNGNQQSASSDGLQYNGTNFTGGNFQFIDNLMGENGPIALDRILPSTLVPVSGGLLQQAQQSVANFASSGSSNLLSSTLNTLVGSMVQEGGSSVSNLATQLVGQFLQGSGSGQSGMMADGVFLRPYAGTIDDAYQALVQNGSPTQEAQFFADPSLGGSGYQAVLGPTNNSSLSMVNLDNVLSGGAQQAFQNYLQNNPSAGTNPYQGYANQLISQLPSLFSQTAPGMQLSPTSQQLNSALAASNSAGNTLSFPSLFSGTATPTATLVSASPFGVSAPSNDDSSSHQGVVVVTPTAAESQAYQAKIADSDQRLTEISQQLKTQQQAGQFNQQVLQSLNQILQQAQQIQQNLNTIPANSIPELTTMIRDLHGDIEARQQQENSLSLAVEKLQQQQHAALADRARIVEAEKKSQAAQALPRWRSALEGNSSN